VVITGRARAGRSSWAARPAAIIARLSGVTAVIAGLGGVIAIIARLSGVIAIIGPLSLSCAVVVGLGMASVVVDNPCSRRNLHRNALRERRVADQAGDGWHADNCSRRADDKQFLHGFFLPWIRCP
jgi:hypothetical protein